jgi:hypothetical protein
MNSMFPSDSARRTSAVANVPLHLKINSFATDLISILSEIHDKSLTIFWKSDEGKLMTDENVTLGISNSSESGSINLNF